MFIDQARIHVRAGDGGNGCLAFRREKYVPRGGPSGGNGGRGGDVVIAVDPQLNTLHAFRFKRHFKAARGAHGSGNRRQGKDGSSTTLWVPLGTLVADEDTGELLADLATPEASVTVARGGRGGRGNAVFATPTNQAPRRVEEGGLGEERRLRLELKLLADVGLIGCPNAGKSTLISVLSAARPKIADYPFTTLVPNLGVVEGDDFRTFVVADIPGLIEGAHQGSGLGDRFLRHVERCRVLVHLVDVSPAAGDGPVDLLRAVNEELERYDSALASKPQIVAASKLDAVEPARLAELESHCLREDLELLAVSAVSGEGIDTLKRALFELLGSAAGAPSAESTQ